MPSTWVVMMLWTAWYAQPFPMHTPVADLKDAKPWAVDSFRLALQAHDLAQEIATLRTNLAAAGCPSKNDPADPDGVNYFLWLRKANADLQRQERDLPRKERLLKWRIFTVYVTSAIGDPILRRDPARLLDDAEMIAREYIELLKQSRAKAFEEVFMEHLNSNMAALKGPYYRQVTIMLYRHVAIIPSYDRLLKLDDMEWVNEEQQQWLMDTFDRLRLLMKQEGYRWSNDDGVPRLRPKNEQVFHLLEVGNR